MGYAYDEQTTAALLRQIISRHTPERGAQWLQDRLTEWQQQQALSVFNMAFAAAPRFLGREPVTATLAEQAALPVHLEGYTADRLFRIWWLLQLPIDDKKKYIEIIENLFHAAEMNELVALYGALPLLAFPEAWRLRTAEGIRSNIGSVLEAIMLHNPYPASNLDQPAWNQLVLKAFFTEKPVHLIVGLDRRANPELARILLDYSHERRAAGRPVHPMLWRLVGPFLEETGFEDIERLWLSEYNVEREAAALACHASGYGPARELLEKKPELKAEIEAGQLTWETVAHRVNMAN